MSAAVLSVLAILVAIVSIQFGGVMAKQLFPVAGPFGMTALRLFFASAILLVVFRPWRARLCIKQFKVVFLFGVVLGFMNLCFYLAIERIPLGLAVALEFIGPLSLALFGSNKKSDLLWIMLAALGIVLIAPLTKHSSVDIIGVVFALCAAACWALYMILGQRVARIMHGGVGISLSMTVAAVVILPIAFFADGYATITMNIVPPAILVALLSSAIPYSLEMLALKHIAKKSFSVLMSLEPAMASVAGLILLQESLSTTQVFAISVIVIASLGTTTGISSSLAESGHLQHE